MFDNQDPHFKNFKPCPFCGDKQFRHHTGQTSIGGKSVDIVTIVCDNANCLAVTQMAGLTLEEVRDRWNLRSDSSAIEIERAALERAANQVVAFLPGNPITKPIADLIRMQVSD
jgi:hypothetical protein